MDTAPSHNDPGPAPARTRRRGLNALLPLWALGLLLGGAAVVRYATTEGTRGAAPDRWPGSELVTPREGRSTLLLFAHPQCPCTAASLRELGNAIEAQGQQVDAYALFLDPGSMEEGWTRDDIWEVGEQQAGLTCLPDPDGSEAVRFGARTSGQVLLYDAQGRLGFQGGVTGSRGHDGPSRGRARLEAAMEAARGGTSRAASASDAVFGCPIVEDSGPCPPAPDAPPQS